MYFCFEFTCVMFLEKIEKSKLFKKFQKSKTWSVLGLGPRLMDQNDSEQNELSVSGNKNKGLL